MLSERESHRCASVSKIAHPSTIGTSTKRTAHNKMDYSFFLEATCNDHVEVLQQLLESGSDEEQEKRKGRGGSVRGKARNIERSHQEAPHRLYPQYFPAGPIYNEKFFRRRFRLSRSVYDRIMSAVVADDSYFVQRKDCTGRNGLTGHRKSTATLRMMSYGFCADAIDEKLAISE